LKRKEWGKTGSEDAMPADRQEQAQRELGRTEVGRWTAWGLSLAFWVTLVVPPVVDLTRRSAGQAWGELGQALRGGFATIASGQPLTGNDQLLEALDRVERRVEELSLLRDRVLPEVQWLLTRGLGAGNEQAYLGLGHWLFYRDDVDHVAGRGFLDPERLERRRRGGEAWEAPVEPDPLPALRLLEGDLERREIQLVLLPVPVKPSIHPERFSARVDREAAPLRNPSFEAFASRATEAGIHVLDIASALSPREGEAPSYLATDTHWTPRSVERVAALLASHLEHPLPAPGRQERRFERRPVEINGRGDLAEMLRLPPHGRIYADQRVEAREVLVEGRPWRSEREADILLLGDSFTNIFSDPSLGWGTGAGLAEQLAYELRRPVDRIARNAGGARAAREALARESGRLEGKQWVVYQFAERELSGGDWTPIALPPPG
jgi:hypothetical protein